MRSILLAMLIAAPVLAEEPPPTEEQKQAKSHYQKGTALFNLGEFADAAEEYKAAYKSLPEPVFLFNIAQAYRLAGDLEHAAFFYNSYARNAKDEKTRNEASARAKKLEAMIASGKKPKAEPVGETRFESPDKKPVTPAASPEPKSSAPTNEPMQPESPGPAWSGGSTRLGSMTDLIKEHRDSFRFCYDAWSKKHPKVDGHLKLILTLGPDGKLEMSEAHAAGIKAPELERCLTAMSKQLTYPPSGNGKMTRFTYPFEFKFHP